MSWFEKLKKERLKSDHHQHALSAVVLYKGVPLAFGFNKLVKTHPITRKYDRHKTIHAEISAVLKVRHHALLSKCTLVVYREDRHGNPAMAMPCSVCHQILKELGIKKVTYSTPEGWKDIKL